MIGIKIDYSEEWRPVIGYEGIYEISSYGNVRRIKKCRGTNCGLLKLNESLSGLYVMLRDNGNDKQYKIHTLIGFAFIPNPKKKPQINHKDGNRWNNFLHNLEWVTSSENIQHSHDNLIRNYSAYGERHENSISVSQYSKSGLYLNTFGSINEAGRVLNIDFSNIAKCANGLRNTAGGFVWKCDKKEITVEAINPSDGLVKNLPYRVYKI